MEKIPIIDLSKISNIEDSEIKYDDPVWTSLAQQVRELVGEIGFMQLTNHGIDNEIIENVFRQSKLFFSQSEELKKKYEKPAISDIDHYYGYTKPGRENANYYGDAVFEFRETYDWMEHRGNHPNEELPGFEDSLNTFHEECKRVAKNILRLWSIGLGLDDVDFFLKTSKHWDDPKKATGITSIRLAYYPEIRNVNELPPNSCRINEHSDLNVLTFIFQQDVGGLELKNSDGDWVAVDPIPGAIICNTGKLWEFWTAGLFTATPHRILIPNTEEKRAKARYSISYFTGPDTTEWIMPLVNIVKTPREEERIAKSKNIYPSGPINALDTVMHTLSLAYKHNEVNKSDE